jgi:FkbM family methyltransferase
MFKKMFYALRTRGTWGALKLLGGYLRWYAAKAFSQDRKFLCRFKDYRMYVNLDDPGISTTLGRGGTREKDFAKVLCEELRPGMTVLDIGANLGYYALMEAAIVGPQGKVYAVEPIPDNYRFLTANVALNQFTGRVETFSMAISDFTGKQQIFLSKLSNLNTLFPGNEEKQAMTGKALEVPVMDIFSFCLGKRKVDLIRMDIEGAEVEVLEGVADHLDRHTFAPEILFETHLSKYTAIHSLEVPLRRLFSRGYYVKRLTSNSDDGRKWQSLGYVPAELIPTDGTMRGIYAGISPEHAIELICRKGGVRSILLALQDVKE